MQHLYAVFDTVQLATVQLANPLTMDHDQYRGAFQYMCRACLCSRTFISGYLDTDPTPRKEGIHLKKYGRLSRYDRVNFQSLANGTHSVGNIVKVISLGLSQLNPNSKLQVETGTVCTVGLGLGLGLIIKDIAHVKISSWSVHTPS